MYSEHQFDQLYSELDPSGYRTPGPGSGGPGTPFGPLSRNISSENLASMNALTNTDISASALHSRLSTLHANRFGQHSPGEPVGSPTESHPNSRNMNVHFGDYFGPSSGSNSHSPGSPELSRRPSDDGGDHEPIASGMATPYLHPQYAEVETLSRVPSYSTAVRAAVGPCDSALPDYSAAMASSLPTPVLQSPQQAYLRSGRSSGYTTPLEVNTPGPFHAHGIHADDAERRLRLVQARART